MAPTTASISAIAAVKFPDLKSAIIYSPSVTRVSRSAMHVGRSLRLAALF